MIAVMRNVLSAVVTVHAASLPASPGNTQAPSPSKLHAVRSVHTSGVSEHSAAPFSTLQYWPLPHIVPLSPPHAHCVEVPPLPSATPATTSAPEVSAHTGATWVQKHAPALPSERSLEVVHVLVLLENLL